MRASYWVSTALYGCVPPFGIIVAGVALRDGNWILLAASVLAVLVALDNFFCASRARKAGGKAEGHYALPWRR